MSARWGDKGTGMDGWVDVSKVKSYRNRDGWVDVSKVKSYRNSDGWMGGC